MTDNEQTKMYTKHDHLLELPKCSTERNQNKRLQLVDQKPTRGRLGGCGKRLLPRILQRRTKEVLYGKVLPVVPARQAPLVIRQI